MAAEQKSRQTKQFGYIRVSTATQAIKGNSLAEQQAQLMEHGVKKRNIYRDVYTGATTDRPQLKRLIKRLQEGDTLIVTKLDRISRSVSDGAVLIQSLIDRGIRIKILSMGDMAMDNTPAGKLIVHIFLSFAEFERDMIIQRTREGRLASGHLGGRPRISEEKISHALVLLETKSYRQVARETGISKSTLLRARRRMRGISDRGPDQEKTADLNSANKGVTGN